MRLTNDNDDIDNATFINIVMTRTWYAYEVVWSCQCCFITALPSYDFWNFEILKTMQ